jgi:DNA topoisomerase-1
VKLIVTEKYKQALNIAKALGKYKIINKRYLNKNIKIIISPNYIILPLLGHITEYDTIYNLKDWSFYSVLEILRNKNSIVKIIKEKSYEEAIKDWAKKADEIIIATDSDEEGENIGLEVIEILKNNNIQKRIKRLWLTTTLPTDILNSLKNLREFRMPVALSVEARRKIDALTGFSGTRELTLRLSNEKYKDIFSFGRVQTATLWLIVQREREILNFKPEKYWKIKLNVLNTNFIYQENQIFNKQKAFEIYNKIKNSKYIKILEVKEERQKLNPPTPLNTNKMLEVASRILNISPSKVMDLAEELYLEGIITYPRVDNQKYSENFNHEENLKRLINSNFSNYIQKLINNKFFYPTKGKYVEDHEPITPIKGIKNYKNELGYKLYEIILRHYLSILSPPAIILKIKIIGEVEGEKFIAEGEKILSKGFLEIFYSKYEEKYIDDFKINNFYKINKIKLEEKQTRPPNRYTESSLIAKMEEVNIGTKSTRPYIIEILKERDYINKKGRTLYPTEKGNKLIEILEKVWGNYITPEFTSKVEEKMEKIAKGEIFWEDVVEEERKQFLEAILKLRENFKI